MATKKSTGTGSKPRSAGRAGFKQLLQDKKNLSKEEFERKHPPRKDKIELTESLVREASERVAKGESYTALAAETGGMIGRTKLKNAVLKYRNKQKAANFKGKGGKKSTKGEGKRGAKSGGGEEKTYNFVTLNNEKGSVMAKTRQEAEKKVLATYRSVKSIKLAA